MSFRIFSFLEKTHTSLPTSPASQATGDHWFAFCMNLLFWTVRISGLILYVAFRDRHLSLGIIFSRFIHVSRYEHFIPFNCQIILLTHIPPFVYPFLCWWAFGLFLLFGSWEYEYSRASFAGCNELPLSSLERLLRGCVWVLAALRDSFLAPVLPPCEEGTLGRQAGAEGACFSPSSLPFPGLSALAWHSFPGTCVHWETEEHIPPAVRASSKYSLVGLLDLQRMNANFWKANSVVLIQSLKETQPPLSRMPRLRIWVSLCITCLVWHTPIGK